MHPIDAKYRNAPDPKAQLAEILRAKPPAKFAKREPLQGPSMHGVLTLAMPLPPYTLSPNARPGLRTLMGARKKYHADAANALALQGAPQWLLDACRVDLLVRSPQARRHDRDNVIARCKALFDALVRWGVLRDDVGMTIGDVRREASTERRVVVTLTTPGDP